MKEIATFAAGCFWGIEKAFRALDGVIETQVGYAGGKTEDPTYGAVCGGETGHAEAVRVTFDPSIVSYDALLQTFWEIHDPTARDRVKFDVGGQYRSAIFFYNQAQEKSARASMRAEELSGKHERSIATEIAPAGAWWAAEEYHQQYLEKVAARKPKIGV